MIVTVVTAAIFILVPIFVTTVLFIVIKKPTSKVRALVDQIPGPRAVVVFGNALQFKTSGSGIQ